jgi:hypothetical protein
LSKHHDQHHHCQISDDIEHNVTPAIATARNIMKLITRLLICAACAVPLYLSDPPASMIQPGVTFGSTKNEVAIILSVSLFAFLAACAIALHLWRIFITPVFENRDAAKSAARQAQYSRDRAAGYAMRCSNCRNELSSQAHTCPNCGHPKGGEWLN